MSKYSCTVIDTFGDETKIEVAIDESGFFWLNVDDEHSMCLSKDEALAVYQRLHEALGIEPE